MISMIQITAHRIDSVISTAYGVDRDKESASQCYLSLQIMYLNREKRSPKETILTKHTHKQNTHILFSIGFNNQIFIETIIYINMYT